MVLVRSVLAVVAALAFREASALTIHRSFRARDVGFGGGSKVSVPVDSKVAETLDSQREKDAERPKVAVGRVTKVMSGDTIRIVTGGGTCVNVRLDQVDAPDVGQPYGKESAVFLKKLVQGRQVRVEYTKCDERGCALGVVTLNKTDVNQKVIAAGMARHGGAFDKASAYVAAETAARAEKKGLWSDEAKGSPKLGQP